MLRTSKKIFSILICCTILINLFLPIVPVSATSNSVLIIGDSISQRSKDQIKARYGGNCANWVSNQENGHDHIEAECGNLTLNATDGRKFGEGFSTYNKYKNKIYDTIIIELGSNNYENHSPLSESEVKNFVNAINNNTKIYFVTNYNGNLGDYYDTHNNKYFKNVAKSNPNVNTIDWAKQVATGGYLENDDLHPNINGRELLASLYFQVAPYSNNHTTTTIDSITNAAGNQMTNSTLEFFNANNIKFYNPAGNSCVTLPLGSYDGTASSGLSSQQASFIDTYHDIAETLTIEFGIPWEAVVAQGINESAAGTSDFAINRNNFFGIAAYDSNTGAAYSYPTPAAGWRGYYENIVKTSTYRNHGVFQNGYTINFTPKPSEHTRTTRDNITNPYDYLQTVWDAGYATSTTYYHDIFPLVTAVLERAAEKGWQTTEELAASHPELLTNAAKNATGSTITSGGSVNSGTSNNICSSTSGQGNGSINQTAIDLAWSKNDSSRPPEVTTPKPAYQSALQIVGLWTGSGTCEGIGAACDRFVTTVMRYSGVDPNFVSGTAAALVDYMDSSSLYEEVPNLGDTSNLQPGDIIGIKRNGGGSTGHVMIYVQTPDGGFGTAAASRCDYSGQINSYSPTDSISGQPWRIFRYKG